MRQRGLAAARAAGDQIEGELGNPAPQYFVEPRHPGRQLVNHDALAHFFSLGARSSMVGQALRSTWVTSRSPMKGREQRQEGSKQGHSRLLIDDGPLRLQMLAELRRALEDGDLGKISQLAGRQLRAAHE
jgi:hypothetical protein